MNELFRFVTLRAPRKSKNTSGHLIPISAENALGKKLENIKTLDGISHRMEMGYLAKEHLEAYRLELGFQEEYTAVFTAIMGQKKYSKEKAKKVVEEVFGKEVERITMHSVFQKDYNNASEFILASKVANNVGGGVLEEVVKSYKVISLIKALAAGMVLEDAGTYLASFLQLPGSIFPLPGLWEGVRLPDPPADEDAGKQEELQKQADRLEFAIEWLMDLPLSDYEEAEPEETPEGGYYTEMVPEEHIRASGDFDGLLQRAPRFLGLSPAVGRDASADESLEMAQREPLILKAAAVGGLGQSVLLEINNLGLDLNRDSVPKVVERLETRRKSTLLELEKYEIEGSKKAIRFGSSKFEGPQERLPIGLEPSLSPYKPKKRGAIQSVGIGDLYVIEEKIKKYDAGEVAHIENALKGEFRQRIHRKLNRSEETSIFEEETAKEEQEELATTERFELQHETSKVISEEIENKMAHGFSVETGGEGSAGAYSFYIDAGYNYAGESSSSNSMEKSDQQSSTFSREVTSKAATRIAERRREELVKKVLEEIEETNTHEIDNKGEGATHVTGIYQWVDKVYEVRKYNYGSHMMFDIMVPEPGAFYREALLSHPPEGSEFLEPAPFDKKASEITASNYLKYTKKYKVTGIEPPPLKYITLSKVFKQKAPNNEGTSSSMIEGEEINIPEGYQAVSANVVVSSGYFSGPKVENMDLGKLKAHVRLSLGRKTWDKKQYIGGTKHSYKLNNEKGSIPISLRTFNTTAFIANIEVNCQRTTRAYLEWQIRTHAAIMEQYLNLKMEYEESLAAAGIRQGIAIQGRNPEENRKIEKAELKKLCLSIITGQHFDDFDSLYYPDDSPLPQIKFHTAQSEGLYIRFFEQAFEWENMMYVFYPYFWSRKALWLDRLFIQDTDPLHVEFLKSGSARVVLPVRENFEEPVLHFLETGEIPTTEELCDINSDLYLPIAEEIKEKQGASNGKYRPVDTWEVRLPTQLVILRPDGTLPNWESEEEE